VGSVELEELDQTDLMVTVPGTVPMAVEEEVGEETEEVTAEVTVAEGVMEEVEEMVVEVVWGLMDLTVTAPGMDPVAVEEEVEEEKLAVLEAWAASEAWEVWDLPVLILTVCGTGPGLVTGKMEGPGGNNPTAVGGKERRAPNPLASTRSRRKYSIMKTITPKLTDLPQSNSEEYFPLDWQMLTSLRLLMVQATVAAPGLAVVMEREEGGEEAESVG